jgi:multiple sugar transport system permease protein
MDSETCTLRRRANRFLDDHYLLVLLGPALLVLLVLFVYPVAWVLYRSLWLPPIYPGQGHQFAPSGNYGRMVTSPYFRRSVVRTLVYAGGSLSLSMIGGLIVALALDHLPTRRLRRAYTTVLVLGLAIPVSVLALVWRWILHPSDAGLVNRVLLDISVVGTPIPFLESEALALPIVTLIDAWVRLPFAMIVFFAGLQSIPERLYDAAEVDGATTFQAFRQVTLPYLRPYTAVVALLTLTFALQAFTVVWNTTGGGPNGQTRTLAPYIYEVGIMQFNFGYGAAISTTLVAVATVLTFLYDRTVERTESRR